MSIQDLIFACGGLIFALALTPSIRSTLDKPALSTCIMSALILSAFSVNDLTFAHPLYLACVTTSLNATAWVVLGVQQFRRKRFAQRVRYDLMHGNAEPFI